MRWPCLVRSSPVITDPVSVPRRQVDQFARRNDPGMPQSTHARTAYSKLLFDTGLPVIPYPMSSTNNRYNCQEAAPLGESILF